MRVCPRLFLINFEFDENETVLVYSLASVVDFRGNSAPTKKKQGDLNASALLEAINWVVFSRR